MTKTHHLFLKALACSNSSRPPVWLMRQAGRYLPEYRALRQKYSFLEMCHQPELVAEVTLMPIKRFGFDAAILFSDILVIPEAMNLGLRFEEQAGPIIERPIQSIVDIEQLPNASQVSALDYVTKGIALLKSELTVPLIGFCGAPFTIASYMIQGKSSRDLKLTKQWMFAQPSAFHSLLTKIADWSIAYLNMQIDAGVHALQIFDSWANFLGNAQFREYGLRYYDYILKGLKDPKIPVILFCKGSSVFAPQMAEVNPSAISLDWNCSMAQMRKQVPKNIALQGNLDPDVLCAPLEVVKKEVNRILDEMEMDSGYIFNLGHGITPDVPLEAVQVLVDCVRQRE